MIIRTKEELETITKSPNVYVVGAGNYGIIVGEYLNCNNIYWNGYIDKIKAGGQCLGKEIYAFTNDFPDNSIYVIAASFAVAEHLKSQLIAVGISGGKIYELECHDSDLIYHLLPNQQEIKYFENRIRELRNIYQGKRCFIIGNGPSLRIEDLDKLTNEITFACNSIYAVYPHTTWRPSCYAYTDAMGIRRLAEDKVLQWLLDENYLFFTSYTTKTAFLSCEEKDCSKIYYMKTINGIHNDEEGISALFSEECDKKVYTVGSVLYTLCQMAIFMGVNEIVLLGVDMNYSVEKKYTGEILENDVIDHQELIQKEDMRYSEDILMYHGSPYMGYTDNQLAGFIAMKKCADKRGVRVYNATRGGKLEVFERVNFDSLF